jgi:hypothetical protein
LDSIFLVNTRAIFFHEDPRWWWGEEIEEGSRNKLKDA